MTQNENPSLAELQTLEARIALLESKVERLEKVIVAISTATDPRRPTIDRNQVRIDSF